MIFAYIGLVKSPVYMLTLVAASWQILAVATFLGFEPKYLEVQFDIPASKANIITGKSSETSHGLITSPS